VIGVPSIPAFQRRSVSPRPVAFPYCRWPDQKSLWFGRTFIQPTQRMLGGVVFASKLKSPARCLAGKRVRGAGWGGRAALVDR